MHTTLLSHQRHKLKFLLLSLACFSYLGLLAQGPVYEMHWTSNGDPILTTGTAGTVSTFNIDSACSFLNLQVTDTANAPLPAFNAYTLDPKDSQGNDIIDLSNNLGVYARVRSADTVRLALLLRSGGGASSERSNRIELSVPGGNVWTDLFFDFNASNIAGFDSLDFKDIWIYLDRGDSNFAGNDFSFDYVTIGTTPDPANNSTCMASMPMASGALYEMHWASNSDPILTSGTAGTVSTFDIDSACSLLNIQVTDTANAPLPAFNAYTLNPQDSLGNEIIDLSNNLGVYARVKSAETVRLALLLRSGGGTSAERSDRIELSVPGGNIWTDLFFDFNAGNVSGFDSLDFRDIWIYLDRGDSNFAGNDFSIDYMSIGAASDPANNSSCLDSMPPMPQNDLLYSLHWADANDPIFSGSGGATLNQTINVACSEIALAVADTANAPLSAFSPIIINPKDTAGAELIDLSGNMNFHFRARSRDSVTLGFLLRSGDGSAAFRSDLQQQLIPGDTAAWTNVTFNVDTSNLGGFDSTDLRDVWVYLDRGTDNFAGNEFYFDYFSIGGTPDTSLNSTCITDTMTTPTDTTQGVQYTFHWAQNDSLFSGSGSSTLTQTIDSVCSQLSIAVSDPANNPLGAFSPLIVNPLDSMGNDIVDLSNSTQIHLRVRSKDTVMLGYIARSGDGSSAFRSNLQEVMIPGDTLSWTEVSFSLDASSIGGFDSTDLRDLWLYLDRGTDNFAGNEFYFDYFAIGERPDPADDSDCSLFPPFEFPYILHWADTLEGVIGGSGAAQLTQIIDTACSQLSVAVSDPIGDPHPAFRPLVINPSDDFGNDITDISGQMRFYTRVRSAAPVSLGMVLRAGSGSSGERTAIVEQMVPGDLTQWTELTYTFNGADYMGFDSTDMRDFWFYLDREDANFAGNEFYFDYVSIGSKPDATQNSLCVETVSIEETFASGSIKLYPNPSTDFETVSLDFESAALANYQLRVYDIQGRLVYQDQVQGQIGTNRYQIPNQGLEAGMYSIQLSANGQTGFVKWIIR
ncbi:MAG: T9SS type A sorting domain-containing protein [Bacteroidota bacterium]